MTRPVVLSLALVAALAGVAFADIDTTPPDAATKAEIEKKIAEGDAARKEAEDALMAAEQAETAAEKAEWDAKGPDDPAAKKANETLDAARKRLRDALGKLRKSRDETIALVDEKYKITPPKGGKKEPKYDPNLPIEAVTGTKGTVLIGEKGFHDPGTGKPDAGWLASTKAHEFLHVEDNAAAGWATPPNMPEGWLEQANALDECRCYDWELANAKKHGLSDAGVERLKKLRRKHYDKLNDENKKKVDGAKPNYDSTCEPVKAGGAAPAEPPEKKKGETFDSFHLPAGTGARYFGNGTTYSVAAWFENRTASPVQVSIATGTTFRPRTDGVQTMMAARSPDFWIAPGTIGWATLPAFCTDRTLRPPAAGEEVVPFPPPGWVPSPMAPTPSASEGARLAPSLLSAFEVLVDRSLFRPVELVPVSAFRPSEAVWYPMRSTHGFVLQPFEPLSPGPFEKSQPPAFSQPGPVVVTPGTAANPPPAPKVGFPETVVLWTGWAVANHGGKADGDAIAKGASEQFQKTGVAKAKADAAGRQVANEVVPLVEASLARAKENADVGIDWAALDLSLKP